MIVTSSSVFFIDAIASRTREMTVALRTQIGLPFVTDQSSGPDWGVLAYSFTN
jgi:hypothetical protein